MLLNMCQKMYECFLYCTLAMHTLYGQYQFSQNTLIKRFWFLLCREYSRLHNKFTNPTCCLFAKCVIHSKIFSLFFFWQPNQIKNLQLLHYYYFDVVVFQLLLVPGWSRISTSVESSVVDNACSFVGKSELVTSACWPIKQFFTKL